MPVETPVTGKEIARVRLASAADYERVASAAGEAFLRWRELPAPMRGDYVRRIGNALREHKEALGHLVSWEVGKILEEGRGEVQEAIDVADFAVGLSRQLYGLTIQSERPCHHMRETWQPLGVVGVITAFNFPAAVWAWNSMLGLICGDSLVWKPSSKAPLTAIAMTRIAGSVLEPDGFGALLSLVVGGRADVGEALIADPRVPLVSATGSTRMGRHINRVVAGRLGRTLLELGGNNGLIVLDDADLDLALRAIVFGAVGTTGQRCTTTRRLICERGIRPALEERLVQSYQTVRIGNPLDPETLMGPLVDKNALDEMQAGLRTIQEQGGEVLWGGKVLELPGELQGGYYAEPCLVRASHDMPIVHQETFAPILYLIEVDSFETALREHNCVPQGLSSSLFTSNVRRAEEFLSARGSDCGIANVNLGT
ncbi:MAG: aldehyde dehydrogenase family protein, partial [Planctomycetota bacterium]